MARHKTYELKINDKQIKFNGMQEIADYLGTSKPSVAKFFNNQPRNEILNYKIEILQISDGERKLDKPSNSHLAKQKLDIMLEAGLMKPHPIYSHVYVSRDGETVITCTLSKKTNKSQWSDRVFRTAKYILYKRIGFNRTPECRNIIGKYIHQLVAATWVHNDDPETKIEVNHIDENKINNNADNLEWVSHVDNMRHSNIQWGTGNIVIKQLRDSLGNEFNSINEASRYHKVTSAVISAYLLGFRKTVGGITFEEIGKTPYDEYMRSVKSCTVKYINIKVWKAIGQGKNARKGEFVGEYETSGSMNKALNLNVNMSSTTKTSYGYIIEADRKDGE